MQQRFSQNSVFITGGSSGIGAALGRVFAREGARVALLARRIEKLETVCADIASNGGQALALQGSITDRAALDAAVNKTVESFGGIDVVVANAGYGVVGPLDKLKVDDYRRQFDTNFFGTLETIYATLPHLRERRGRLAIISSVVGRIGTARSTPYCASKFALCGLAEGLYHEFHDDGVSVTLICPGYVETEIFQVDKYGRHHPDWQVCAPQSLMNPADKVARAIIRAIYKRKPEVVITAHGKFAVACSRYLPRTTFHFARRAMRGKLWLRDRS